MSEASSTIRLQTRVPARSIALPVEHGAWGFLFEPALAGLILAPSLAAPFVLLFFVGSFLVRHPLKFVIGDLRQGRRLPRTTLAFQFAAIYGAIAALGLMGMALTAPSDAFLPLITVAPLVIYLVAQDVMRQSRDLLPELTAAFTLASSITVFALAGGWSSITAFALWAVMIARLVPSVLYVRSRLRLEKGKQYSLLSSVASHILAVLALSALWSFGLASILTVLMAVFLTGRAAYGLSRYRKVLKAKVIGMWEVGYGVLYALTVVLGFYLSI